MKKFTKKTGQILPIVLVAMVILAFFGLTISEIGYVALDKIRTQVAADAGALAGATYFARQKNTESMQNMTTNILTSMIFNFTKFIPLEQILYNHRFCITDYILFESLLNFFPLFGDWLMTKKGEAKEKYEVTGVKRDGLFITDVSELKVTKRNFFQRHLTPKKLKDARFLGKIGRKTRKSKTGRGISGLFRFGAGALHYIFLSGRSRYTRPLITRPVKGLSQLSGIDEPLDKAEEYAESNYPDASHIITDIEPKSLAGDFFFSFPVKTYKFKKIPLTTVSEWGVPFGSWGWAEDCHASPSWNMIYTGLIATIPVGLTVLMTHLVAAKPSTDPFFYPNLGFFYLINTYLTALPIANMLRSVLYTDQKKETTQSFLLPGSSFINILLPPSEVFVKVEGEKIPLLYHFLPKNMKKMSSYAIARVHKKANKPPLALIQFAGQIFYGVELINSSSSLYDWGTKYKLE